MIRFIASLSPVEIGLIALAWAAVCAAITIWLCPRLFQHLPKDWE